MTLLMLVCSCVSVMAADDGESGNVGKKSSLDEVSEILNADGYSVYYEAIKAIAAEASKETRYSAYDAFFAEDSTTDAKQLTVKDSDGNDVKVVLLPADGTVSFKVDVPETAIYTIRIVYCTDGTDIDGTSAIERTFRIDGELPFSEARSLEFRRAWEDTFLSGDNYEVKYEEDGKKFVTDRDTPDSYKKYIGEDGIIRKLSDGKPAFKWDINDNDIRVAKNQVAGNFTEKYFSDSTGYVADPFCFYIEEGTHTLSLEAVRDEFYLAEIVLGPSQATPSYDEYIKANEGKKNEAAFDENTCYIEAEYPTAVSDKSLYALNDRTSALTHPQDPAKTKLNAIGASKWQEIGQWISYDIEVPADGLYNISLRYKQNTMEGLFTSRKLTIDGTAPFKEAEKLRFNYSRKWQLGYLCNENGDAFSFYLTKGKHTISFEVVLGDMSSVLSKVSDANSHINKMYLQILMLTGSDPDAYIDYQFIANLPEVVKGLRAEGVNLAEIADELAQTVGEYGSNTATLQKTANLCKKIGKDTDLIARNLDRLKSDIGTIGTWIQTASKQPLTLDYILITPVGTDVSDISIESNPKLKSEANPFEAAWFELQSFAKSFSTDYSTIGMTTELDEENEDEVVEVWYAVDRDRATVIRQMIDNNFTSVTGIPVEFKLVAGGTLLPSILAGVGPDVMIGLGSSDVINYAIRGAIKSLTDFPDLAEVVSQYDESAIKPLTLYGQTYGLPMTMNFPMLFYRADVLMELGLDIPETWEDFYDIIPALLENKLDLGYPVGETGLYLFLLQTDESLYKKYTVKNADGTTSELEGMQINLDSNTALSCFKKMCDLITLYDLPLTYSFANRFRTGEMPIGIQDIGLYNELTLFAPEIKGLWGMVSVPGTEMEDGTVDYSSPVGVSATVIIDEGEDKDYNNAWEFVKWWCGTEAQSEFGSETVAIMGDGAKYFTANTAALESLPWTKTEYDNIIYQFSKLSAKPEMPGGYIITRYVTFAYQAVYNDKVDAVDQMNSYIDEINAELSRKRVEFELATIDDFDKQEDGTLVPKKEGMILADDGRLYDEAGFAAYEAAKKAASGN